MKKQVFKQSNNISRTLLEQLQHAQKNDGTDIGIFQEEVSRQLRSRSSWPSWILEKRFGPRTGPARKKEISCVKNTLVPIKLLLCHIPTCY